MNRGIRKILCVATSWGLVAGAAAGPLAQQSGEYLGPCDVVVCKDGKSLLVLNADAKQVAVVDVGGKVTRSIRMPATPTGMVLAPHGDELYVTCAAPEGLVCVVDISSGRLATTIPAGHTATGPSVSPDGKRLYVCNRFDNDVSVIDLERKMELARVPTSREPIASAVTPDGKLLLVANHLPADRADQHGVDAVSAVVTVIDTQTKQPSAIRLTTGSSSVRDICVSPDGKYAYVVHILSRYHLPTVQVERGWMNTNAMSIIDVSTKKLINTVLLDELGRGAANPWGVACTADGERICVSHAGTHELSLIDAVSLLKKLTSMPLAGNCYSNAYMYGEPYYDYEYGAYGAVTAADVANNLTFLSGLRRRIKLEGKGARGLAVAGSKVYVTEYFTDTLAVVDLKAQPEKLVSSIPLGSRPVPTLRRKGHMYFCDAAFCFEQWQSCNSCHPDGRMDGLNWDLLNDGVGNPKNVKSMLLAHKAPPAMALGVRLNAECAVRSGIAHIQFAVCPDEVAAAIDEYLRALEPVPSPLLVDGQLSTAARRGKKLFFSEKLGCAKCHPPPLYTDMLMHDVGSKGQYDRRGDFDTPTLIEVWRTSPYLHDGHYTTIKELIVKGKHDNSGDRLDQLSEQQINDLVEFVMSL